LQIPNGNRAVDQQEPPEGQVMLHRFSIRQESRERLSFCRMGIMMFSTSFLFIYTLVALLFLTHSLSEGEHRGGSWDLDRVAGVLLCLVWPLTLAGICLVAYQEGKIGDPSGLARDPSKRVGISRIATGYGAVWHDRAEEEQIRLGFLQSLRRLAAGSDRDDRSARQ
jgi:hypothetical protein